MVAIVVYAKCDKIERLALWDDIYSMYHNIRVSWMVGGDFNVIINKEKEIGGLSVYPNEYKDFAFCINSCDIADIMFKWSPFTQWNGRADDPCIFKRLDIIVIN